jgi:putative transposase
MHCPQGKEGRMAKKNPGPFSAELLDALLEGRDPKSVLDSGGLIGDKKKALAERMLNAEMDVHLESEAGIATF